MDAERGPIHTCVDEVESGEKEENPPAFSHRGSQEGRHGQHGPYHTRAPPKPPGRAIQRGKR
eukprot:4049123-Amphidinium_carterae.1